MGKVSTPAGAGQTPVKGLYGITPCYDDAGNVVLVIGRHGGAAVELTLSPEQTEELIVALQTAVEGARARAAGGGTA